MSQATEKQALWVPGTERIEAAAMTRFIATAGERGHIRVTGEPAADFATLWQWSVSESAAFWTLVAESCALVSSGDRGDAGYGLQRMAPPDEREGPRWFPGLRLNFAENLLRGSGERPAIISWNEEGRQAVVTLAELRARAASIAAALTDAGVVPGDRVAGYLPNIPNAVACMLGAASIGAVWSSCSPDFGVQGVIDRFSQIQPKILFCADGYRYSGKEIDSLTRVREIAARLPSIQQIIVIPYRSASPEIAGIPNARTFSDFIATGSASPSVDGKGASRAYRQFPFDHPLYVMYSSGTTGLPKCMVHGAGGTLLQHLKEHQLHCDIRRGDIVFYFTTCGWMMWNWLVSALASEATIVLYDGAPLAPRKTTLWAMAEQERITVFGTSARYIAMCEKSGLRPGNRHDLSSLRTILSTGSPLASHSFDYVYRDIKSDVHLASISGGTDIVSCFALGNPTAPVYRGELQTRGLGMAVDVFDENGNSLRGAAGELVCTKPFPSVPVAFWDDADGAKYRSAYFDHFPGVWRHGDWAELTPRDGMIIHGRSDATLNPGGVRIGTAEIYRQVEQLPEILESVAVGQETGSGGEARIVLFVRMSDGFVLDEKLCDRIRTRIRENTSPLHVPKKILAVADIPRTISGKISEIAVRESLHGRPVKNVEALANPDSLEIYRKLAPNT